MQFSELVDKIKSKVIDITVITDTEDEFEFELNTSRYCSICVRSDGTLKTFRKDNEGNKVVHFYSNNTFDNFASLFEEGSELWKLI